jgi:Transcriptional regulatory protein, C terminal
MSSSILLSTLLSALVLWSLSLGPNSFFWKRSCANAGRVVTRDRLIEIVWGNEREVESNTLDVYVRQLRSKIEPAGSQKLIQTIRGVGYAMREEEPS